MSVYFETYQTVIQFTPVAESSFDFTDQITLAPNRYPVYHCYDLQKLEDWILKNRQNLACKILNVQL